MSHVARVSAWLMSHTWITNKWVTHVVSQVVMSHARVRDLFICVCDSWWLFDIYMREFVTCSYVSGRVTHSFVYATVGGTLISRWESSWLVHMYMGEWLIHLYMRQLVALWYPDERVRDLFICIWESDSFICICNSLWHFDIQMREFVTCCEQAMSCEQTMPHLQMSRVARVSAWLMSHIWITDEWVTHVVSQYH